MDAWCTVLRGASGLPPGKAAWGAGMLSSARSLARGMEMRSVLEHAPRKWDESGEIGDGGETGGEHQRTPAP